MAAGVIPGSRAAAPIVAGRRALSAWRASNDNARIDAKSRSAGISVDCPPPAHSAGNGRPGPTMAREVCR